MPWEKQFNRDEVLERAMQTFWKRGYEATSIGDLVEATGINRGSLYGTYTDKRGLFIEALRLYDETRRRRFLADLEAKHKPREAIRRFFMAFAATVSGASPGPGCFMTNTALELAPHDPEVRELVAASQKEIEAFFARLIRKGQAEGEIPSGLRASDTARGLLASMVGLIVLSRSRPEPALLKSIAEEALQRLD